MVKIAEHNGIKVAVTYITEDLTWALVSQDTEKYTKRYKVNVDDLTNFSNKDAKALAKAVKNSYKN